MSRFKNKKTKIPVYGSCHNFTDVGMAMREWCSEICGGGSKNWGRCASIHGYLFYFTREDDAALFMLKWGEYVDHRYM